MLMEKTISRSVRLICSGGVVIAGFGFGQTAFAQQTDNGAPIARVEVTGSSLKRVDAETALPVQLISKAEIARSGATSTEDLLTMISSLSSSGATSNATGAGSSTGGLSSVSLRGLGSARTLVLVNGRRLAAFAGSSDGASVNVNAIPLAAIERVEILKDGASGVYGSDAVAGVVNFILSKRIEGVEVSGSLGSPTEAGGGQNKKASITGGINNDKLSVVLSGSYEKEKALFGRSRDYAASATKLPYYSGTATGSGNIQGAFVNGKKDTGFSNGGSGYGNPLASPDKCSTIRMAMLPDGAKGAPYCYYDSGPDVGLTPDRELVNLTGNFSYQVNSSVELFGDLLLSQSKVTQTYQPSPARASFFEGDGKFAEQGVTPALLLDPSNPVYQSIAVPYLQSHGFTSLIGKPLSITNRVFDFGPRQNVDTAKQGRLVLGARGSVASQDYEVAVTHNESRLTSAVTTGYFSQVEYARIINDPTNNWNPWIAGGVQTGALADKLKAARFSGDFLHAKTASDTLDAKITGEFLKLGDITPQYAAGLQSRHEKLVTDPSAAYASGDISGLGGSVVPIDRSRVVNSVFGELNVPFTKTLEGNVTVRDDRYNDFGNTVNYKLSTRWHPVKEWLFRASYGTGFRAPTLVDLWTPQTIGTSESFNDPKTNQSGLQVNALVGGNPTLTPEKSKQYSIGTVWQPTNTASLGIDWFRINVRDIISTPSAQEIVSRFRRGDPAYANLVTLAGDDVESIVSLLSNNGNATVQGVDIFGNYRVDFSGLGRLDLALNSTYMSKFDQSSGDGTVSRKVGSMVERDGSPVIGAQNGGVILRWKGQVAATWTTGPWAVTLIDNFRSGYEVGHDLNENRVFIGRESIFDANVTYKGFPNVTLAVGAKNLFDKQPGTIGTAVTNQFQSGYDINQYDPRGRFVYVTASYKF